MANPPDAWLPAQRLVQSMWAPIDRFLHVEAASGIILLIAAAVALAGLAVAQPATAPSGGAKPRRFGTAVPAAGRSST